MKVLYILSSTDEFGGASKAVLNILNYLSKRDKHVDFLVVVPDYKGLYSYLKDFGINVVVLNYRMAIFPPKNSFKSYLLYFPRLLGRIILNKIASQKLLKILRTSFMPDIVHSNVSVIDIGYRVAKRLNLPHIYHIREYADLDFKMYRYIGKKWFYKNLLSRNSYNICITKDIQKYYMQANNNNSIVIYDGVLSEKKLRFSSNKEKYFLFAGRLENAKGIDVLIKQYALYVEAKKQQGECCDIITLKIAGDTVDQTYKQYLFNLVATYLLDGYVEFLGMRSDVYDLMYKAYALFVPSHFEGFGFITAEAMFNGCLVVGRNTAGTREQFDNGFNLIGKEIGIRFDKDDCIFEKMLEIDKNGVDFYFSMIQNSQLVVSKYYSNEISVNQIYSLYKHII